MDLFTLSATLGLDIGPFKTGLGLAQKAIGVAVDAMEDVLDTGMGFDKQMSAVQAVLGQEEATIEHMNTLREFALDTARGSIFTAEETAKAYYYMGMAGWKTEQMLAGLPGVIALAAASGEDLGRVSDIVTDSITAFGLSADDVSWYVDILAQTATNSNTDVKRMGETFKYIAPIAGSLGASVDDVALSIGLLASAGIKGSMAGTALRNIFTRISTNAGATNKDLGALEILTEKLGVQFWDSAGKMRDWSDILKEARVAWQGLTQEEQVYYSKQIGSQRGMAAWLTLMNATEEDVNKLAKSYENAAGAAQTMADVRMDNLWGDIEYFKAALDVLKIYIYDDVKSPIRDVVQFGTDALNRITDALKEDGLMGGIRQLGTEIRAFEEEYGDEIREFVRSLLPIILDVVSELAPPIIEAIGGVAMDVGGGFLQGVADTLAHPEEHLWPALQRFANAWWEGFKRSSKKILDIGTEIIRTIGEGFVNSFSSVFQWGRDLIDNFTAGISSRWEKLRSTLSDVAGTVRSFLGFSEPEQGPLSNFHTYAPDMMKLFAQGIKDNEHLISDQIGKSFDFGPQIPEPNGAAFIPSSRQPAQKPIQIVFMIDGVQRWVYNATQAEQQRVGVKLATGGAY